MTYQGDMAKKTKLPPEFDPVLPIPLVPGSMLPEVKQGDGAHFLRLDTPTVTVELPYNAFFLFWEWAEARARDEYHKYLGVMPHVAEARLRTVVACRNAALSAVDQPPLKVYSEEKAAKARRILAKIQAEEAAKAKRKRKTAGSEDGPEPAVSAAPTRKAQERPRKRSKAQKPRQRRKK